MNKIRICGVGSVLLGDDAVGPYAARWIAARYEFGENVEVEDLGTPGLDLIAYLSGVDVLILIDSVDNGHPPGTVTVYDKAEITRRRPPARLDPHSPCITESIFIAELAGDGPAHVYLIGITGEQFEVGAPLSDAVRSSVSAAIEAVLQRVAEHGGSYSRRKIPQNASIWWEARPSTLLHNPPVS